MEGIKLYHAVIFADIEVHLILEIDDCGSVHSTCLSVEEVKQRQPLVPKLLQKC